MPSGGIGYPNPRRYWGFLRMTLAEVFKAKDADALVKELQNELSTASADEQLFFFHYEPLEVASKVTQQTPDSNMLDEYAKLVRQFDWQP